MAANDRVERQLEALKALRNVPPDETAVAVIRKALNDRVNLVVAKAAAIAQELELKQLVPDLLKAFGRMFEKPAEIDPKCWAKNAIAKALKDLGHAESAPFLRGLRHIQMEAIWGGKVDTANTLRGACALALVQCNDIPRSAILRHLIDSLTEETDPLNKVSATVRTDAARAIEQMEGEEAMLLLRLKARASDDDPTVTGQVLESLLRVEGPAGIPFVAEFLDNRKEEVCEEAALALGTSRLVEATTVLKRAWEKMRGSQVGAAVLRALSASRQDDALGYLIGIVRDGRQRDAADAIRALELHRNSEDIRVRVSVAVTNRGEPSLSELFQECFRN